MQVANADKVKEQYGNTIGNLTLTMYNQEMSNNLYADKKDFYKNSNVSLTREIAKSYDHWNREAIIDRTEKMTKELTNIFPKPNIKEAMKKNFPVSIQLIKQLM